MGNPTSFRHGQDSSRGKTNTHGFARLTVMMMGNPAKILTGTRLFRRETNTRGFARLAMIMMHMMGKLRDDDLAKNKILNAKHRASLFLASEQCLSNGEDNTRSADCNNKELDIAETRVTGFTQVRS